MASKLAKGYGENGACGDACNRDEPPCTKRSDIVCLGMVWSLKAVGVLKMMSHLKFLKFTQTLGKVAFKVNANVWVTSYDAILWTILLYLVFF